MGTVVAMLKFVQPILEDVAVWRFDHRVWQSVLIVDDAIGEEVRSLLTVRYYWLPLLSLLGAPLVYGTTQFTWSIFFRS